MCIRDRADTLSVSGWPNTIWLTQQERRDRDQAIFGQLSFDVTDKLELNAGGRWFTTRNSLKGYFGFANGYSSGSSLDPVSYTHLDVYKRQVPNRCGSRFTPAAWRSGGALSLGWGP